MNITRRFYFTPQWRSRGFSNESTDDLYSLPSFNTIAKFLNDNGWEIIKFEYIDDHFSVWSKTPSMNELEIYARKKVSKNYEEEDHYFIVVDKNGTLVSEREYYHLPKEFIEKY